MTIDPTWYEYGKKFTFKPSMGTVQEDGSVRIGQTVFTQEKIDAVGSGFQKLIGLFERIDNAGAANKRKFLEMVAAHMPEGSDVSETITSASAEQQKAFFQEFAKGMLSVDDKSMEFVDPNFFGNA